jgi:hypothetical protein
MIVFLAGGFAIGFGVPTVSKEPVHVRMDARGYVVER